MGHHEGRNHVINILKEIAAAKRLEIERLKAELPVESLQRQLPDHTAGTFRRALEGETETKIIAELKKGSPSRGIMVENFDPAALAAKYRDGGAVALSVLTERKYFYGRTEYLKEAAEASSLPVLCKDFILEPYQLYYARYSGADAVLLIVRLHSSGMLTELIKTASDLGLDCLVETHDSDEVKMAVDCGADIIGVNNRNLDDFSISLETSERLASLIPDNAIRVSESGIGTPDDIVRLRDSGYTRFLIGEALMTADDPVRLLQSLRTA